MRHEGAKAKTFKLRADLLGLLLMSLVVIAALTMAIGGPDVHAFAAVAPRKVLLLSIGVGAVAFVVLSVALLLNAVRGAKFEAKQAKDEIAELRKALVATQAVLKAEPQVLLFWEENGQPRLIAHTLETVAGIPGRLDDLLRFGAWLDAETVVELRTNLDTLFTQGKPFNIFMRTLAGGFTEADGRVAGARAILKLRDVAGQKKELARIVDQHRRVGRDIAVGRALFDALPMPVWLRSADGRIEWVNHAYARAVDAETPQEVSERQIEFLESRQRKAVEASLNKRETYKERTHIIVGGERRAFDLIVLPLERSSAGVAVDAAALETVQGELDRQSAAHDRTLDRVATAVAVFGPDQRLNFFNDAFHKLWKIDPDWLATKPADGEILDRLREMRRLPEVANYRDFRTRALARYGTQAEHEDWWHLPDGRNIHMTAVPRPDGGLTYLYDDATEKLALQRLYKLTIDVQKETLDHLKEAVALFATDGRLKLFNPAFARIWKLDRSALEREPHIDEIIRQMRSLHEDPVAWTKVKRAVTAFSDRRQPASDQMMRTDGSVIDYALLPLPDGATLLTFADVTDTKRIERVLTERNEALIAADRLKTQFISHVSYELRTPLQTISGFAELLASPRTGLLSEKQREYLTAILSSSETLKIVINDILDLATIDAGALELKLTRVNVKDTIDAAVAEARDRLTKAGLKLDIVVADDVTELTADENRVKQVLSNLLSNAAGFSEPGKSIQILCHRDQGQIVFCVTDEGVGVAKDEQERIFDRFVSRAQGSNHRGAGLGLPLVKSLVELHGGTVAFKSEVGQGTTVVVSFPDRGRLPAAAIATTPDPGSDPQTEAEPDAAMHTAATEQSVLQPEPASDPAPGAPDPVSSLAPGIRQEAKSIKGGKSGTRRTAPRQ